MAFNLRRGGGALVIEGGGVFGPNEARAMAAIAVAEARKAHIVKALYDLRGAVIVMGEHQLYSLAGEMRQSVVDAPVGMLVDPSYHEAMWRYCLAMAQYGRTRLPFSDPQLAQRWLGTTAPYLRPISLGARGRQAVQR